jgi:hypothetical protein
VQVSKIIRGSEAVDYIKSELIAVEPDLESTTGQVGLAKQVHGVTRKAATKCTVYRDLYADNFQFKSEDMVK